MGKFEDKNVKQTEEWLDDRYVINQMESSTEADLLYYNGAIKAIEFLGYEWTRDENGKHKLYKRAA